MNGDLSSGWILTIKVTSSWGCYYSAKYDWICNCKLYIWLVVLNGFNHSEKYQSVGKDDIPCIYIYYGKIQVMFETTTQLQRIRIYFDSPLVEISVSHPYTTRSEPWKPGRIGRWPVWKITKVSLLSLSPCIPCIQITEIAGGVGYLTRVLSLFNQGVITFCYI